MDKLLDRFQPGVTAYVPGASGEIAALREALAAEPDRLDRVRLVSCLLPGMNSFDYAALHPAARLTCFLLPPLLRPSLIAGKIALMPLPYSAIATFLRRESSLDLAVAHVAPPRADGTCSVGIAADFSAIAWRAARTRALVVNQAMPDMPRGPRLSLADADVIVEGDGELVTGADSAPSSELSTIARTVADLVPDGAAIQVGVGGAPAEVWRFLGDHRRLRLASGLVSDGFLNLAGSGALDGDAAHRAGVAYGSSALYDALAKLDLVEFAGVNETHDACLLGRLERFTAINSALEIDLFGQANLEWQGGRPMSGVGGAPDFARAAARSNGGRFIVALPATAKGGSISRIVARLGGPAASIARTDIDTVVTEYGAAPLRHMPPDARAEALIGIAAPEWRDGLAEQWRCIRNGF